MAPRGRGVKGAEQVGLNGRRLTFHANTSGRVPETQRYGLVRLQPARMRRGFCTRCSET